MSIQYSDGDIESQILGILQCASDVNSETPIACEHYDQWPIRYHLTPERANLLRHLSFEGLDVLEIGAGMGAVSRYIAENAQSLTVVEGTQRRFNGLSQRLKDLDNWKGIVGNFQDVSLDQEFDLICLNGVLEYSELYIHPPADYAGSPFQWFLEKATSCLKADGVLSVAIENKLGLKYWSGAGEDHTNRLFDGICGYPAVASPRTFSRKELRGLLNRSGLVHVDEYYPFPDYKLPSSVLSEELVERQPRLASELATIRPYENYGSSRRTMFPEPLAMDSIADAGLLKEFSNSFLFLAARRRNSATLSKLQKARLENGEIGWHYSSFQRRTLSQTTFYSDGEVAKKPLRRPHTASLFHWHALDREPLTEGESLRLQLVRLAYYRDWDAFLERLVRFIEWSFTKWADGSHLKGEAIDAIFFNANISAENYELFDLEWCSEIPVSRSWFVFRNVYGLTRESYLYCDQARFKNPRELYELLCHLVGTAPDIDADMRQEALFQSQVTRIEEEQCLEALQGLAESPFGPDQMSRDPARELQIISVVDETECVAIRPPDTIREKVSLWIKGTPWIREPLKLSYRGASFLRQKIAAW